GIPAAEALEKGIVDALSHGDLEADSRAFLVRLIDQGRPPRPTRGIPLPAYDEAAFDALAERLTRRTAGQDAPAACVAAVRRALTLPFDEAIAADREAFAALSAGAQSRALRHAFFAEREAGKLAATAAPRPIAS